MEYRKGLPTEAGYYWRLDPQKRILGDERPMEIIVLFKVESGLYEGSHSIPHKDRYLYAGPILRPDHPKTEETQTS